MEVIKSLNFLRKPGKSLSQRALVSSIWVFLLRVFQQTFGLTRLVILARVLSPNDFGLMGIALLVMATLETFSQTGFQQALIQRKYEIKSYLDSVWTFLILRGFVIFAVLYIIAPYAASFFNAPEAKSIIQVIGLSVVFQAFANIGVIYFQKELEFNKQFIYQLSGTLTDFIVAIVFVFIFGNVWALVFGMLAGNAAMCITSYLVHSYRPQFNFDLGKIRELCQYGKWVFGSTILVFLVTQGDDILVGKMLSVTALGYYQLAYRISNLPATEITHLISQVTFPMYSKIQDDSVKLKTAYLKVLQFTAYITFFITSLIFTLASYITNIFLGEKWLPIVPLINILVLAGLIRSIQATSGPIFYALGMTKIDTKVQVIRFIVLAVTIYPLILKLGLNGAAIAVLISILVACIQSMIMIIKTLGIFSGELFFIFGCPFISSIVTIIITLHFKLIFSTGFIELLVLAFITFIAYFSSMLTMHIILKNGLCRNPT